MKQSILEKLGITPGLWAWENYKDTLHVFVDNEMGSPSICKVFGKTNEARARLIAQAPTMFIWIKGMLDCADSGNMIKAAKLLEVGKEIIEQATGKTWAEIKQLTETDDAGFTNQV